MQIPQYVYTQMDAPHVPITIGDNLETFLIATVFLICAAAVVITVVVVFGHNERLKDQQLTLESIEEIKSGQALAIAEKKLEIIQNILS